MHFKPRCYEFIDFFFLFLLSFIILNIIRGGDIQLIVKYDFVTQKMHTTILPYIWRLVYGNSGISSNIISDTFFPLADKYRITACLVQFD